MVVGARAETELGEDALTCVSTVFGLRKSLRRCAQFERPSAMSPSTSRSRGVSVVERVVRARRRPSSCATTSGSTTVPPAATRRSGVERTRRASSDAVLEQVADAVRALARAARARAAASTYCDSTRTPTSGCSAGSARRPRRPSSVWVGGMRMSTTATSGSARSHRSPEPVGVADRRDDLEARVREHPREALAEQRGVVGDHDAHGISAVDARAAAGRAVDPRRPSSAATRSARPRSPQPAGSAPPTPSSATSTTS